MKNAPISDLPTHLRETVGMIAEAAGLPMGEDALVRTYFEALARLRINDPEALRTLLGGNGASPMLVGMTEEDEA